MTFLLWTPILAILDICCRRKVLRGMRGFYGLLSFLLGIRLEIKGKPLNTFPTLYVANHSSYTDILVLGSVLSASFVAKQEVKHWPLIGWMAAKHGALFVKRSRLAIQTYIQQLQHCLSNGNAFILFPEGTSSDGCQVLPFFSGFLECGDVKPFTGQFRVQPISLIYESLDGFPMNRALRKQYAWTGDLGFFEHLWEIAKMRRVKVRICFHEALDPHMFSSRKTLTQAAYSIIRKGFFDG